MSHRRLAAWVSVIAIGWLTPGASAQAPGSTEPVADHTVPRTADGRPDLTGFWTTQTFTPMERPDYLGDKAFYTEEEWTQLQAQLTVEGADPLARSVITIADPEERARVLDQTHRDETYVHYDNAIWLATRVPKGLSTRRTSLVTDPPDGRIPPRNDAAQARAAARRAERGDRGAFDGYELRPLSERCIAYGYNGPRCDLHRAEQQPAADRPARRPTGHLRQDPDVSRRLAWPVGRRHAGGREQPLQR
jgi:hypothetical protein